MPTILQDNSQTIVFQKASQMAVSTYCILWTIFLCKNKITPRGIIYWLPTVSSVRDFVNTKVDSFLDENEEFLNYTTDSSDQTYNQGLKFIYGIPTFWRGLESKTGVKSISADAAIYDEFDEADQSQVTQARQRLSASDIKLSRELSVPTMPDYGINKSFQSTDQCHFAFKCESCNHYNILEENFPNCFKKDLSNNYYHACKHCSSRLDISKGIWIKKNHNNKLRGYQISQLYSPFITPNEIMKEYETTQFLGHFYNHVLGLPYLSATDRVTQAQILSLCDNNQLMSLDSRDSTAMGIDQGSKLHIIIMRYKNQKPHVIHICERTHFEEIDHLIRKFNVRECVIDAMPETRKARELMRRFPTKVWLNYYNDNQKGSFAFNEIERIVTVNRTESLDVGTFSIINQELKLPRCNPQVEEFASHAANIAKTIEENHDTGSKKYVYRKLGPDHYRHALNYAQIGLSRMKNSNVISVFR